MFERVFDVYEYEGDVGFSAAGFAVEPMRLPHYTLETYGFRVTENGTTLAYSGDSGPSERLSDLAAGTDLFICEATLADGIADGLPRGHLSIDEAVAAAEAAGCRRLLITHRPSELGVPAGLELAADGMTVDI
jgi:ribonuclease BN (tRNA processing enzyme)